MIFSHSQDIHIVFLVFPLFHIVLSLYSSYMIFLWFPQFCSPRKIYSWNPQADRIAPVARLWTAPWPASWVASGKTLWSQVRNRAAFVLGALVRFCWGGLVLDRFSTFLLGWEFKVLDSVVRFFFVFKVSNFSICLGGWLFCISCVLPHLFTLIALWSSWRKKVDLFLELSHEPTLSWFILISHALRCWHVSYVPRDSTHTLT